MTITTDFSVAANGDIRYTDAAKSALKMRLRLYSVDDAGVKTFDTEQHDVELADVEAWVVAHVANGDTRGVQAMQHVKEMVALIVETELPWGDAVVS
jgi:hypothetical protein